MILSSLPASAFAEEGVAEEAAAELVSEETIAESAGAAAADEAAEERGAEEDAPDSSPAFEEEPLAEAAAPGEAPAPTLCPVDAEIAVRDRVAETLSAAQPSYNLRLTVEYNRRLLLRYTGAVGFVLRSEQSDASRPFVNAPDEDGAWPEAEEVLTLTKGSYTLTVCPIKPVNDGSSWPFTLVFEPYVEAAPDESVAEPLEEEAAETEAEEAEDAPALIDRCGAEDALWHEDALYLTGLLPEEAVVDAQPVTVEIAGQEAALAYEISIYANDEQQEKAETWQPAGDTITVHFAAEGLTGEVDVFHLSDADGRPEYLGTATVVDGWVSFEAARFSVYALTETALTKTVSIGDGASYEITATYAKDAGIPMQGTELLVRELTEDDPDYASYRAASLETLGFDGDSLALSRAFDIKIVDANDHSRIYEPQSPVELSIRLIGTALGVGGDVGVAHFAADGGTEALTPVVDGETLRFTTDSFSVYVVNEQTHLRTYLFFTLNEYGEYIEYTPYTESGTTTVTQIIKNGETPIAPQNPTNLYDPSATFAGWYKGTLEVDVLRLEDAPYDFANIPAITENEQVRLYAVFMSYAYVIFHGQYDPETRTYPVAFTRRVELNDEGGDAPSGAVKISDLRAAYQGEGNTMLFSAWSATPIRTPGNAYDDNGQLVTPVVTDGDGKITVTGTTHLYPIYRSVYWLSFYSGPTGSGATYYQETAYYDGVGPTGLGDRLPTRDKAAPTATDPNGCTYAFDGWYAGAALDANGEVTADSGVKLVNADGTLAANGTSATGISVSEGKLVLTADVTLYAAWKKTAITEAHYAVVVKRQKSNGSALDDYEFTESFLLTGTIGHTVAPGAYADLTTDATYNSLHEGASDSGATNPYHDYHYVSADSGVTVAADGSTILNVFYDWNDWNNPPNPSGQAFTLRFLDSVSPANEGLPVVYDGSDAHPKITYGTALAAYEPAAPTRTGYSFTGWYVDAACTLRAFFHTPSAEELEPLQIKNYNAETGKYIWDGHSYTSYVVYSAMPGTDLTVYAGWEENWYVVTIDPNYGAMYSYNSSTGKLEGTGSTWFWAAYGSTIQEYTTVKRDYVRSEAGTWYYVNHSGDGAGSSVWPDRYTYYTQDPSKATEFGTYEHEADTYRYLGWYEVGEGGVETLYDFSSIVDHDITLKLNWMRIGAFYLEYDPGDGSLDQSHENEKLYVELDGDAYNDNAEVVVTRVANAPDGYEFIGWRLRGDESGTVYRAGQSFPLLSRYAVTVQGRRTLYLDAVYEQVPMASVIYHANGGTLNAVSDNGIDYGHPDESGAPTPVTDFSSESGTAEIANLVNNSRFILSDGTGFSRDGASFRGWCKNPVYDPNDASAPLLTSETVTNVDANEPLELYAVWEVTVSFHLNESTANASFGDTPWDSVYTLNAAGDIYTRSFYVGSEDVGLALPRPDYTLNYTGTPNKLFRYWATRTGAEGSYVYTQYDFSTPVTGALELYAYWTAPISVPTRVVDASAKNLAEKTSSDEGWTVTNIELGAAPITLTSAVPSGAVTAPEHMLYAFATVHSTADSLDTLQEKRVQTLRYDAVDGEAHVVYADGSDAALADGEAIYLVYYADETLSISYWKMAYDGPLSAVTISGSAPVSTGLLSGNTGNVYDVASAVTTPLAWKTDPATHNYYAYALGTAAADNASKLFLITEASKSDSDRPALRVRNSWRGFQYSIDDGASWVDCEYDVAIFVVYFPEQPTIVTFREETYSTASDVKNEKFTFDYQIYNVTTTDNHASYTETLIYSSLQAQGGVTIELPSGEAFSTILFTGEYTAAGATTQKVVVNQTPKAGYSTTVPVGNNAVSGGTLTYSYTARWDSELGKPQTATFTNRRDAYSIEAHVAVVDVNTGGISNEDGSWRSSTEADYRFDLALGASETFLTRLPHSSLVSGHPDYSCGAIFYGYELNGAVIPASDESLTVSSVAFEAKESGSNEYGVYLKDSAGHRLLDLSDPEQHYSLYYLYYPLLQVRYVVERDGGVLEPITGAAAQGRAITYSGAVMTLNSVTVMQNQSVEMPAEGLLISQSVGGGVFNMPPLLDDGDKQLNLVYAKIGVFSDPTRSTVVSDINTLGTAVSEERYLDLRLANNKLSWSFDGTFNQTEGNDGVFSSWPVVYAIYRERGYALEISKTVPIDTGYDEPFTVTLTSTAINRAKYSVEGTGYAEIDAIPAVIENGVLREGTGTISFPMLDGNAVQVFGLGAGEYTVTESGNENYILSAEVKFGDADAVAVGAAPGEGEDEPAAYFDAGDANSIHLSLSEGTKLTLTNTAKVICKVGVVNFYTISSAIRYMQDFKFSDEIEMLVDYLLPESDAATIPSYLNVVLTTAAEFTSANGRPAVITRSPSYSDGAMLTNLGTLTLRNITLDGGSLGSVVASAAMLRNQGTLTVADGATLQNANAANGLGAAIAAEKGSVSMSGGTITNCSSFLGGAIYATGGDLTLSGGTITGCAATMGGALYYAGSGAVTVNGSAELTGNDASMTGGAIHIESGTLNVAGGVIHHNSAASGLFFMLGGGGAIYAQDATVNISGGTIRHNSAASGYGGAVYIHAIQLNITGGTIHDNSAGYYGGALYTETGEVNISGGTIRENTVPYGDGGALYSSTSSVTVSGTAAITGNSAENGGAIYADAGSVTLSGANVSITGNRANAGSYSGGNGGAVYAASAAVTLSGATLNGNSADLRGGAIWIGSGAATLTGSTLRDNSAGNGAAIFVDTGAVRFNGGSVTGNTAGLRGGAVAVGSEDAKLYFAGDITVTDNSGATGESTSEPRNVYLDQDTDTVINAAGLGAGANVGVYVPGTMDDALFRNRGVPSCRFATFSDDANYGRFANDRQTLAVGKEDSSYKLYWVSDVTIEVWYLASFTAGLPSATVPAAAQRKGSVTTMPSVSRLSISALAEEVRGASGVSGVPSSAVFGAAFVKNGEASSFADYLTGMEWDSEHSAWKYQKRDGSWVWENVEKLIVYFTEPYYLSIENNADLETLTISSLTVSGGTIGPVSVINGASLVGYGYVFSANEVIQDSLYPITAEALVLEAAESIQIMIPGGSGLSYTLTGSYNAVPAGGISYTNNSGSGGTVSAAAPDTFTASGTLDRNDGKSTLIFGGARAICKIVIGSVVTEATGGYVKKHENSDGSCEYAFSTPKQAAEFIRAHPGYFYNEANNTLTAAIQMIADYMIPSNQQVVLPETTYKATISFTTARDGYYRYPGTAEDRRAAISRAAGNNKSFIVFQWSSVPSPVVVKDTLILRDLIFDGKSYSTGIDGGIAKTIDWNVEISNVDFNNCVAKNGGGIYIDFTPEEEGGSLTVQNSRFTNCRSTSTENRQGGGAIWTYARTLTLDGCVFSDCSGVDQGGAIFHRIDYKPGSSLPLCNFRTATVTDISNCLFTNCQSRTGGAVESDAYDICFTGSQFTNCQSVPGHNNKLGSGGAIGTYIYEDGNTSYGNRDTKLSVSGCTFTNCTAAYGTGFYGNGGAIRSHSRTTTISDSSFTNCTANNNGGAICINNTKAPTAAVAGVPYAATISGCAITGCKTTAGFGGAVYSNTDALSFDKVGNIGTTITGCSTPHDGGGVYHGYAASADPVSSFTATGLTIMACSAASSGKSDLGGGALFTAAAGVNITDSAFTACSTPKRGGGVCVQKNSTALSVTLNGVTIENCNAGTDGGGLSVVGSTTGTTLTLSDCTIGSASARNTADGQGGGVYTNAAAVTVTGAVEGAGITGNIAVGNGGGIALDNASAVLTLDGASIQNNISSGMGGGAYTKGALVLKGATSVTDNRLTTTVYENAAGVYVPNGKKVTVGAVGSEAASHLLNIKDNKAIDGVSSDLRLPETSGGKTNSVSVDVLSGVRGEVNVVNAKIKGTQFGTAVGEGNTSPVGFTDAGWVFRSEGNELHGIVDRSDATHTKIIWGSDPVCKITDESGKLLYLDSAQTNPAVFDRLDGGGSGTTSAFSVLRASDPNLYYADGTKYTGSVYCVKMLVEEYAATQPITTFANTSKSSRTVILTTAGSKDSYYRYRGESGTRCRILRDPSMDSASPMFTVKSNLSLQSIILDGGSTNGVTPSGNTRIITADLGSNASVITVTLGRNATLQNAAVIAGGSGDSVGKGGAVYCNWSAALSIEGGTIRSCSAVYGGGVYVDGSKSNFNMSAGTINRCEASQDGGGVYILKSTNTLQISGGTISRCEAGNDGGAVYLSNGNKTGRTLQISGGTMTGNHAGRKGGAIAGLKYDTKPTRIYLSGAPYIYGNTSGTEKKACNIEMDQGFTFNADITEKDSPNTMLVSRGLIRGAAIGVYVPDENMLYEKHGAEGDPFATYTDSAHAGLSYFINDRNGMKGSVLEGQSSGNQKIYWQKIYTLEVSMQILSDDDADFDKTYNFTVELSGSAYSPSDTSTNPTIPASNINDLYGEMNFRAGHASFSLKNGETIIAEKLPYGFSYTVTETLSEEDAAHFKTTVTNPDGRVSSGTVATGQMMPVDKYIYSLRFSNISAICKLTTDSAGLLYTQNYKGEIVPAVYDNLVLAFTRVSAGSERIWYYRDGDHYQQIYPTAFNIELLIPEVELTSATEAHLTAGVATLTTADPDADDGFPYVGTAAAKIVRGRDSGSLLVVGGDLTLDNIILDGGSAAETPRRTNADGGAVRVEAGGSLTLGTNVTVQNSTSSGKGAGVYLAEGATLKISGAPVFRNNVSTLALPEGAQNGFAAYTAAKQDVYIDGYETENAASLVVTGNLTGAAGSIWVWAANPRHFIEGTQFARVLNNATGLDVLRNARTDAETYNSRTAAPLYLAGVSGGDGLVYWPGSVQTLTVTERVDDEEPEEAGGFPFTVGGLTSGRAYAADRYTSADGSTWTLSHGESLTADEHGAISFTLAHNERVDLTLPTGETVTVSQTPGSYQASYAVGNAASVAGSTTGTLTLSADVTVAFTNTRSEDLPAPTGLRLDAAPWALLLLLGLLLLPVSRRRRKRAEA